MTERKLGVRPIVFDPLKMEWLLPFCDPLTLSTSHQRRARPLVANHAREQGLAMDPRPEAYILEFKTFVSLSAQGWSSLCNKWNILFLMTTRGQSHCFGYAWGHPSTTQKVYSYKTQSRWAYPLGSLLRAEPTSISHRLLVIAPNPSRFLTVALWIPTKCPAYASHRMRYSTWGQTQLLLQRSMTMKLQQQCCIGSTQQ